MANWSASANLQTALELNCEKLSKPASTMLFHRGEKAFGMFLILSGRIRLDFGADTPTAGLWGPGALVGFPATLTRRRYSMTATVVEAAELGFISPETLDMILRGNDDFICRELLGLLGEKLAELQKVTKALIDNDRLPAQQSTIA
jgi:CRP-like cAMP-binding protein